MHARTRSAAAAAGEPLAAVYAGHQFGVWAGRLGDGRAILLGEAVGPDGGRWEIQLKGSGKTPYSRMGDGRAVLRSSIREFLCSEAMAALGIPTSRALCVIGSDAPVYRETVETAAVATRLAPTWIRFGTFEYFYYFDQHDRLRQLADFVIEHYFPQLRDAPAPYAALLHEVTERTARLIARWQSVGFCHGVMNTDNMSILGITIDYGPFGFLDAFDANHICNHSDHSGRYSYAAQPAVAEWNCYALAQAMLPLIGEVDAAQQALAAFRPAFAAEFATVMRAKLGLQTEQPGDDALLQRLFQALHANRADFTLFFRRLAGVRSADAAGDAPVRDLFIDRDAADRWLEDYRARLRADTVASPAGTADSDALRAQRMNRANPKYVLRNHLAEIAIRLARGEAADGTRTGVRDFGEVERLLQVLAHPFDEQPQHDAYARLPPSWSSTLEVSCSS
jgi:serine/tyrosine/threonine adenylyltransferase